MKPQRYSIRTTSDVQFVNIDHLVREAVVQSGVQEGLCVIWVPHTTAGVTINENADPDVVRDIIMEINKIIPFDDGYRHMEGNSAAHIKSSLVSPSLTLLISQGRPVFGTWQSLYFCEFDGPRSRNVLIKITEG